MRKLLLGMRKLAIPAALAGLIVAVAMPPNVSAQRPQGPSQSDHALMDASEHIHCGVALGNSGKKAESYTLHVTASGGTFLTIQFADFDTISFAIPGGGSVSTTQELGGVPEVDDVVKITVTPSGDAMASVKVRAGSQDPFTDDGELDNFCLTHLNAGGGDPGDVPVGYPL